MLVLDSSPLITLSKINQLPLLHESAQETFLPPAVYEEVFTPDTTGPKPQVVEQARWLVTRSVQNFSLVKQLTKRLGKGEAEAIVLAKEIPGSMVVIDDALGRKTALEQGVPVVGLLGLFVHAKKLRMIPGIHSLLLQIQQAGFCLDTRLVNTVLKECGED